MRRQGRDAALAASRRRSPRVTQTPAMRRKSTAAPSRDTPGTPAIARALESGTALAATGVMKYLSRPEDLRSALASVDSFIALRAGASFSRPRVHLVAVVPSGSVALITRVEAGVVVPDAATLWSVASSH